MDVTYMKYTNCGDQKDNVDWVLEPKGNIKNSRRVIYGTHIQKCVRFCIEQREIFYRWVPEQ